MEDNSNRIPSSKRIIMNDVYGNLGRKKCIDLAVACIQKNCTVYYILPSRASMYDVRQQLIHRLGGLFGCKVFGFADFEKLLAGGTIECLSADRQMALIEEIAQTVEKDSLFFAVKNKPGFLKRLKSTLIQLGRLSVDSQKWVEWLESVNPDKLLGSKLQELGKLYKLYEEKKAELNVIDVNDYGAITLKGLMDMESLPEVLPQDTTIIIDGFMNIDAIDCALLHAIEQKHIAIYESRPFEATEITAQVTLTNSPCLDHEIRQMALKIKELLIEGGVSPHDMGVIIPNSEPYTEWILKIFDEFGIPMGVRRQSSLDAYPLIKGIFAQWVEAEADLMGNESVRLNRLLVMLTDVHYQPFLEEVNQLYQGESLDGNGRLLHLKAYLSIVEVVRLRLEASGFGCEETDKDAILNKWTQLFHKMTVQDLSRSTAGIRLLDPDQMRGLRFHTLFFLGFNEGLFPGKSKRITLLSDYENEWCANNGMAFGTDAYELDRESHRFYSILNSADAIYLSYRTADESGSLMIPSPFIEELKEHVPIAEDAFEIFTMGKRLEMRHRACSKREVAMIKGLSNQGQRTDGNGDSLVDQAAMTEQLIRVPVSGLSEYTHCPFAYRAKRIWEVNTTDEHSKRQIAIGNAQHLLMKAYFEANDHVEQLDEQRLEQLLEQVITQELLPPMSPDFVLDALEELKAEIRSFVAFEVDQLKHYFSQTGKHLVPTYFEWAFSEIVESEGTIRGRIDRIDLEVDDKNKPTGRFAITDYKKGKCKSVTECIQGVDHQLLAYLAGSQTLLNHPQGMAQEQVLGLIYDSVERCERNGIFKTTMKPLFFPGRKGTKSTLGEKNWKVLIQWEQQNRVGIVKNIKRGVFSKPEQCMEAGEYMSMCPYNHLCRET